MLRDESIEIIKDEFFKKQELLSNYCELVSPASFYNDLFADMDGSVSLIQLDSINDTSGSGGHIVGMNLDEAVSYASGKHDILLGGVTYYRNYISMRTSKDIYAFIVDMDNVTSDFLWEMLLNDWTDVNGHSIPKPTYIVNSGTGLHLYFVLNEVIPCYKSNRSKLNLLYRRLAMIEVSVWQPLDFQMQWYGQNFRMVGSINKYGELNEAFKYGDYWDIDELGVKLGISETFRKYGDPPKTYPKYQKERKSYTVKNSFYTSVLARCKEEITEGHRYLSMMALTVIAYKCSIPLDTLSKDLYELLKIYNARSKTPMHPQEIASALKMYNEKARLVRADILEGWLGWKFKRYNRHTGDQKYPRKLSDEDRRSGKKSNLEAYAWKARDEKYPDNSWMGTGRPDKKKIVQEWRKSNPGKSKADCIKETGLAPKTVYKWWNKNI